MAAFTSPCRFSPSVKRSTTRPSPSGGKSFREPPTAPSRLEPGRATMPGPTPSRKTATALKSVVSGTNEYASPAKTTTAILLPSSWGRSRIKVSTLRVRRDGRRSSQSMESETSSAITRSRVRIVSSAGISPHCGRATATTRKAAAPLQTMRRTTPVAGVPPNNRRQTPGDASRRCCRSRRR